MVPTIVTTHKLLSLSRPGPKTGGLFLPSLLGVLAITGGVCRFAGTAKGGVGFMPIKGQTLARRLLDDNECENRMRYRCLGA